MNKILISLSLAYTVAACQQPSIPVDYLNADAPVEQRVESLMSQMTLEEKIGQMCQYVAPLHIEESKKRIKGEELIHNDQWGLYPGMSADSLRSLVKEGEIGSFLHVKDAKEANELQKLAQATRLKIPLLIGIDAIHGHAMIEGSTVFPTQLGLSSSWDNELLYEVAKATAKEVRATGMHWTFSPNVDVARDPRWGRCGETFGEDPFMVTQMGLAFTNGYQGDFGEDNVLACAKHFIAGSEPYNGTNASPMDASMRQLREIWLPPYKAQAEAEVFTFMAAHNELNGIPCHSNKMLLNDILREEWGYDGFVVSDWMDIERIEKLHHVAGSPKEAIQLSVDAGMDMHMHGPNFLKPLAELVRNGNIDENKINESCRKILTAKFMLGLFENPFVDEGSAAKELYSQQHQELGVEAARKSIILLKNDGLLPFSDQKKILITGPNANNHRLMGDWALPQPEDKITTIYEGFKQVFSDAQVDFVNSGESLRNPDAAALDAAIAQARGYDAIVVAVGSNSLRYEKYEKNCGENVGRSTINLMGNQLELIKRLYEINKNIVIVLVNGRPLSEPWIKENIPAIIEAWEPGSFGGLAIAEIVKGDVNPSGKLTMTFPQHVGQVPMVYNQKPSVFFHKYIDSPSKPLWHFGYGLSYTQFEFSDLQLSASEIAPEDQVSIAVTITNTGDQAGDEIAQLYIRDEVSSVTRPVKELKGYQRISLAPQESKQVVFELVADDLAFYDIDMNYVVEQGSFKIMVGASSADEDLLTTNLELTQSKSMNK
ncbi:glycoside hydrolase family 3 N-terminal domain-containing protein [Reichenbachiella faecimaris]|uniref:glycoside hydrolase family 3 N-terminal domain-containing protein n=1 Tax=Reichenbachiella faecimaris TaxID=692418 RepID=UPI001C86C942|nr:glycoside hydrolase family 3 N-terminal domain-containing protein [Reichenbachiella faecimaris]